MTSLIETLNLFGQRFTDSALPMLIQSSVLIGFLLVLDLVLCKHVRATIRYGLWMLVLIKLILPPSFASPTGLGYWLALKQPDKPLVVTAPVHVTISYPEGERDSKAEPTYLASTTPLPAYTPMLTWPGILLLSWASVAIALVIWLVLRARFVARMSARASNAPESLLELLQSCRQQMGIKQSIRLKLSNEASSPAVCGLWRPTILIPAQLAGKLSALPMRAVLLHELSHIKRGDLWVNYAQTLLQIAYWYNLLLWLANAVIRRVREQAVDEMVMVEMGQEADAYPATLLEVAKLTFTRSVLSLGLVGIMESKGALKERIKTLLSRPIPKVARLGWKGLTCVSLVGLIALPMASHPKANAVEVNDKPSDPAFIVEAAVVTAKKKAAGQFARSPNGPMTGILNPEQTQLAMDMFRRTEGVKIVDSIIENVMNGRKGHFTIFVTGENSKQPSGVECEVLPVLKNGMIDLRVKTRIGESPNPAAGSEAQGSIDVFLKKLAFESSVLLPIGSSTVLHRQEEDGAFENNYWIILTARFASESAAIKTLNTPRYEPHEPLFTRFFKVDTNLLVQALQRRSGSSDNTNLYSGIRDFFMEAGIDLRPPKNLFYKDRQGMLMVRGSLNDLTVVEKTIKDLGAGPASNTAPASLKKESGLRTQTITYEFDEAFLNYFGQQGVEEVAKALAVQDGATNTNNETPVRLKDKVPVLGDLPLIGRFFRLEASLTDHYGVFPGTAPAIDSISGLPVITTGSETNAFEAGPDVPAQIPATRTNKIHAATLVQDGRVLYELGKLDEAEAKLNQALKADLGNFGANYYLNLIREKRYSLIAQDRERTSKDSLPYPNPYARTNMIHTSKGRQAILSKLDRIRLDEVHFSGLPLGDVIKILSIEARKRDPDKTGVDFIINPHTGASRTTNFIAFQSAAPAIDPFTGLPATATVAASEPVDMNALAITINPAITDVRLADVLDAIVAVAGIPIKYSIEDYAVVFSLKGNETPPLFTRFFKVDPKTFYKGLESVGAISLPVISTNSGSRNIVTHQATVDMDQVTVRAFFTACGVDLNPPKNLFLNDGTGTLMVRGTLQDLDIVESAMQSLNVAPPQIQISARFVEVSQNDSRALGFDWFLGNIPLTNGTVLPGNATPSAGVIPSPSNRLRTNGLRNSTTNSAPLLGILTAPQSRVVQRALEQHSGVDSAETTVTTLSGRQAAIEVPNLSSLQKNQFKGTNALDVVLYVSADGYTISLTLLPRVRSQRPIGPVEVRDGHTVVVGNVAETSGDARKLLLLFLTPIIVDPAGNRIQTDDEIPPAKSK